MLLPGQLLQKPVLSRFQSLVLRADQVLELHLVTLVRQEQEATGAVLLAPQDL